MKRRRVTGWVGMLLAVSAVCWGCGSLGTLPLPTSGDGWITGDGGGGGGSFGGGGGTATGEPTGGCLGLGSPNDAVHQSAFDELNYYRATNSRDALQYSVILERAADAHAKDMYERGFFDHTNPDGQTPGDRAVAAGFCHAFGGENIASGQNDLASVSEVMAGWKASPDHNVNMLRPDFVYVGIGYYETTVGRDTFYYWVQLFAFDQ